MIIYKKIIFFLCVFLSILKVEAQSVLYKIQLEDQIKESVLIVEGEVISKKSFFSAINDRIYTIHEIQVFRGFKGSIQESINVVSRGGSIDLRREEIKPNIQLNIGDMGVFMLQENTNEFSDFESELNMYHTYSNLQGFYRYDKYKNTATNPYYIFDGIQTSFYEKLESITATNIELLDYVFPFEIQSKSLAISTASIIGFYPSEIRSGTGDLLTILGTDLGDEIGVVIFRNSDSGGFTSRQAYDSDIESWSNSQIIMRVPSFAGTGIIEVITNDGETIQTTDSLTVLSSELTTEFSAIPEVSYRVKLYNSDNQGGYTWTYNEDFAKNIEAVESFEKAVDAWVCSTSVSWLINENSSDELGTAEDNINLVSFIGGRESNLDEVESGILAVTSSYYIGCQNGDEIISYVSEVDMTFNSDFNWYYGDDELGIGQFENDFQGTATHELGHAHNLGHVIAPNNLMHFETSSGIESATREVDDDSVIGASINYAYSKIIDFCLPRFVIDRACLDDSKIAIEDIASVESPAFDTLFVRIRDLEAFKYSVHIYSLSGREELFEQLVDEDQDDSIDVSLLDTGVYIVKIVIDSQIYVQKVVIQ